MSFHPTEVVVDAGSPLATRAAKDLKESVLFPLSQEVFLNITYLNRMPQDSPPAHPSGNGTWEGLSYALVGVHLFLFLFFFFR